LTLLLDSPLNFLLSLSTSSPQETRITLKTCANQQVAMKEGNYPTLAVCASPKAWYSWTSPSLFTSNATPELIPLGDPKRNRLIVGHGVSFDRIRVKEEYQFKGSSNRFLDTMRFQHSFFFLPSLPPPLSFFRFAFNLSAIAYMYASLGLTPNKNISGLKTKKNLKFSRRRRRKRSIKRFLMWAP